MSVSPFPDPRTNQFNPSAWDFTTYFKYLNSIVTFPRAQQATINFVTAVYLTTRTALTQWADTAYATSEIVAWATANVPALLPNPQTWPNLQYYFGGIAVNTINPLGTGGTVNIGSGYTYSPVFVSGQASRSVVLHLGDGNTSSGAIHIGNGTNTRGNVEILNGTGSTGTITLGSSTSTTTLNAPLTPLYAYPIIPVGAIGYRPPITVTRTTVFNAGPQGVTIKGVTVTAGVWMMCGTVTWNSYPGWYSMIFTTTDGGLSGDLGQKGAFAPLSRPTNPLVTSHFNTAFVPAGFLGFNARSEGTHTVVSEFIVVRVA